MPRTPTVTPRTTRRPVAITPMVRMGVRIPKSLLRKRRWPVYLPGHGRDSFGPTIGAQPDNVGKPRWSAEPRVDVDAVGSERVDAPAGVERGRLRAHKVTTARPTRAVAHRHGPHPSRPSDSGPLRKPGRAGYDQARGYPHLKALRRPQGLPLPASRLSPSGSPPNCHPSGLTFQRLVDPQPGPTILQTRDLIGSLSSPRVAHQCCVRCFHSRAPQEGLASDRSAAGTVPNVGCWCERGRLRTRDKQPGILPTRPPLSRRPAVSSTTQATGRGRSPAQFAVSHLRKGGATPPIRRTAYPRPEGRR